MWMIDNYCTKNAVIVLFQRAGGKPIKEERLFADKWRGSRSSGGETESLEEKKKKSGRKETKVKHVKHSDFNGKMT